MNCRLLSSLLLFLFVVPALADEPKEIRLTEGLGLRSVSRAGRVAVHIDPVEAMIVAGTWKAPKAGDTVTLPDGSTRKWEAVKADAKGLFTGPHFQGGYAFFTVPSDTERVMMLEATGHSMVYVNGEPRTGDPYGTGYVKLPVLLKKGANELLFLTGRGRMEGRLVKAKKEVFIDLSDATLPDFVEGGSQFTNGAALVVNATNKPQEFAITTHCESGVNFVTCISPPMPGLSVRKVDFGCVSNLGGKVTTVKLRRTADDGSPVLDEAKLNLRTRRSDQSYKLTFRSSIDGSVQYYAVQPAPTAIRPDLGLERNDNSERKKPALFLTLHGASVEAMGQADAYTSKTWGHIVAPTNRRPYGFDWEDWGRLDALEVLAEAQKRLKTDPQRTYLTGHSMGGHGVWHLGVTYPTKWAAVGPSAGWVSMFSYAGARKAENATPMQEILQRCMNPSDTLALQKNLGPLGVYVLHGDKDDNVPVTQARKMKEELGAWHKDFHYHEQPGAGHWWGGDQEGCVDWPPMFDLFARHIIPENESVRQVDFVTANPGVSAWSHWVGIEGQIKQLMPSTVHIRYDPSARRFRGTTDNVSRLALNVEHVSPDKPLHVELDGQKLEVVYPPSKTWRRIDLTKEGDKWSTFDFNPMLKAPHRYGLFKDAFRDHFCFVYGTKGTPEENDWALAKARFDAERWWYQANGSVDIYTDNDFLAKFKSGSVIIPADDREYLNRSVILYGNSDTNAAWKWLHGPVQVKRGSIKVGDRELQGDDLACLVIRPLIGEVGCYVAVVAGTGIRGMRLTDRLPYFTSGVAYPDLTILGPKVLSDGFAGVRCAGFFGLDWSVKNGEFVWQE